MARVEQTLYDRIVQRPQRLAREPDGLVEPPLPSDMLQPWEVFDQDLFDLEMVRVFARSWVWLGDTEDLTEPGDYITGRIGSQQVFAVRQEDGSVQGFLNNCPPRSSGVAFGAAGNCQAFASPDHPWT